MCKIGRIKREDYFRTSSEELVRTVAQGEAA